MHISIQEEFEFPMRCIKTTVKGGELTEMNMADLFADYKNEKTALYGLGAETEKALKALNDTCQIVGLLDGFREEGRLYGMPIISLITAVEKNVRLIIVVARPGSCRAIKRRIGDVCKRNGIRLLDIRGIDLLVEKKTAYDFSGVNGVTKAWLMEKIQKMDAVSFDLFDTLVMRRTLYSDDIAEYVDHSLRKKGILIPDFCRKRLQSEKELSKKTASTLTEIYENVMNNVEDSAAAGVTAGQLAEMEWEVDFRLLVPRKEVCRILMGAAAAQKRVYILSDTYYRKEQLEKILEKCGITEYTEIFASCEYGTGKMQDLYEILKGRECAEKCLHIGDDIAADIEAARRHGFETCRLFSGADLLEVVGNLGFTGYMDSLPERLKIGMFTAEIFNSPFQFEEEQGQICIAKAYHIGYLLCAPMISDFVVWLYRCMREQKFRNLWFSARDGYLIQKLYQYLLQLLGEEDRTIYFLTSRTAAIRAGVKNEEDIRYVDEMKFSGTLEKCLRERFGIETGTISGINEPEDRSSLMKYRTVILENAGVARQNYKKYIDRLEIREGDIAFFDFVA